MEMKQPSLPRLFLYTMLIINSGATAIKCRRNAVTKMKHNGIGTRDEITLIKLHFVRLCHHSLSYPISNSSASPDFLSRLNN